MSLVSGLAVRVPFLDHRLVELALRMPQRFHGPGKRLLRAACQDLFSAGYLDRPKQGRTLPMRPWMLAPLQGLCCERLEALQESGCLDSGWDSRQWQTFQSGNLHWARAWSMVVLGEWALREQQP